MALPFVVLAAKGLALAKMAGKVLAEWNPLEPDARRRVEAEAGDVMSSLSELRRALGARVFSGDADDIGWAEAKEIAVNPTLDFQMARRLVEVLIAEQELDEEELRERVGAVSERDAVFRGALQIADDDGYLEDTGVAWRITAFADRDLVESEHVRFIETAIRDYVDEAGLAGRDELALAIGAPGFFSDEFQAGLERALVSGTVVWLGPGLYGVPVAKLDAYDETSEVEADSAVETPRDVKLVLADLKASVDRLRQAMSSARTASEPAAQLGGARSAQGFNVVDPIERLRKLKELHAGGVLTDEEFAAKKQPLLEQI